MVAKRTVLGAADEAVAAVERVIARAERSRKRAGPRRRTIGGVMTSSRVCPVCGTEFQAARGRRYCSKACWPGHLSSYAPPGGVTETSSPVGDGDELNRLLWAAARRGSVAAMVTLRRELKAEQRVDAAPSVIEELASRRRS